jgi:hypothetical protein
MVITIINQGGGHTGHDGKYTNKEDIIEMKKKTVFEKRTSYNLLNFN